VKNIIHALKKRKYGLVVRNIYMVILSLFIGVEFFIRFRRQVIYHDDFMSAVYKTVYYMASYETAPSSDQASHWYIVAYYPKKIKTIKIKSEVNPRLVGATLRDDVT
jgi:predicted nucleotide-binding protein (sugar kinase/HSP70/actin superfamily)